MTRCLHSTDSSSITSNNACKQWNSLPSEIIESASLLGFTHMIEQYLHEQQIMYIIHLSVHGAFMFQISLVFCLIYDSVMWYRYECESKPAKWTLLKKFPTAINFCSCTTLQVSVVLLSWYCILFFFYVPWCELDAFVIPILSQSP